MAGTKPAHDQSRRYYPRGWIPSRTARKRGNALAQSSRGALAMIRMVLWPPKRSHCTTVTLVLSLPLVASIRVS